MKNRDGYAVVDGAIDRTEGPARQTRGEGKADEEALVALCGRLEALPRNQLSALDLHPDLRDALDILFATKTYGAQRRQRMRVVKVMRMVDLDGIDDAMGVGIRQSSEFEDRLRELERWRTKVLAGTATIDAFLDAHPDCDRKRLRQLLRQTLKATRVEKTANAAQKRLFKLLREAAGV